MQMADMLSPTAQISLDGPAHIETESDSTGKFAFNAVPPGAYTINAQAPGLAANRTIEVAAGSPSEIALEMKVQVVVESTMVTAAQIDPKESPGTTTIGESAVRNLPNLDERFNSLLPLIPGFRKLDADLLSNSDAPYELLVESTKGAFFNHQDLNSCDPKMCRITPVVFFRQGSLLVDLGHCICNRKPLDPNGKTTH
jgi:hypothetical protein